MQDSTRKWILWLLPVLILAVIAAPMGIQAYNNYREEKIRQEQLEKEKEEKEALAKKKEEEERKRAEEEARRLEEEEQKRPVMDDYGQPVLELTTGDVVKVKQKSNFDYAKYVKSALNGDGTDSSKNVAWNRIDTGSDVGSILIVNYVLSDARTEEKVAKTLIVEIIK